MRKWIEIFLFAFLHFPKFRDNIGNHSSFSVEKTMPPPTVYHRTSATSWVFQNRECCESPFVLVRSRHRVIRARMRFCSWLQRICSLLKLSFSFPKPPPKRVGSSFRTIFLFRPFYFPFDIEILNHHRCWFLDVLTKIRSALSFVSYSVGSSVWML